MHELQNTNCEILVILHTGQILLDFHLKVTLDNIKMNGKPCANNLNI